MVIYNSLHHLAFEDKNKARAWHFVLH